MPTPVAVLGLQGVDRIAARANGSLARPTQASERYAYDADGMRITRTAGGATWLSLGQGGWDVRQLYTLQGRAVAQQEDTPGSIGYPSGRVFLHGDHLGSASVATDNDRRVVSRQDYTPWGEARAGGVPQTTLDFTGQRRDGTGLLYYGARYYDPQCGQFLSADSVVPGSASGKGGMAATLGQDGGVALRPLTVDFHESGFAATLAREDAFTQAQGFWFQLSDQDKQKGEGAKWQWGPRNPQSLDRYSYVLNNPLRYTDPTGHAENGSYVYNNSSQPVVIRGEKVHEERYRRPGCTDDAANPNNCFYSEEILLPGQSSKELNFVDVDSVRALDGNTLEGRGSEWEYKLYAFSFVEIRDSVRGDTYIYSYFCLLQVTCGKWVKTETNEVPNPPAAPPPSCDSGMCNMYRINPLPLAHSWR